MPKSPPLGKGVFQKSFSNALILLVVIFLVIFVVYFIYVYPLLHLNTVQSKEELVKTNQILLKGIMNPDEFKQLSSNPHDLSFWYIYHNGFLKNGTVIFLIYKCNMFSDKFYFYAYGLDEHDNTFFKREAFYLKDLRIETRAHETFISCGNLFTETINTLENKITVTAGNMIDIEFDITDYNTCCPCLLNYYTKKPFSKMINFTQGNCPNIWASDNQMIGSVTRSVVNGAESTHGNYWTDNFVGFNNYFLPEYVWSYSQTDEWVLYFLWFGNKNEIDKGFVVTGIEVKNKKDNTMICCGMSPDCAPFPINRLGRIIQPHTMKLNTTHELGVDNYDAYDVHFKLNDFECTIHSIKNKSKLVAKFDYYDSEDVDETLLSEWEKEYYKRIKNLEYVEYINDVIIKINYKGNISEFKTKNIVDGMIRKDNSIPVQTNC